MICTRPRSASDLNSFAASSKTYGFSSGVPDLGNSSGMPNSESRYTEWANVGTGNLRKVDAGMSREVYARRFCRFDRIRTRLQRTAKVHFQLRRGGRAIRQS